MKFYHVILNNRLVQGMFATKWRAERYAQTIPGATIVVAAGRAELRSMGIEVDR